MATTDTTDPFARLPNESFYQYLQRIKNIRGMLLGQYDQTTTDPVDEALTEELTQTPLGQEIVQQSDGGSDDNGPQDTRTPEQRKRDMVERAVGLLSGEAASAVGLGTIAGPLGMALGAFADYDTVSQFENELERQGFTKDEIETLKDNPELLQQGLTSGVFGVKSAGYEPTFVDKFSITGMFSDILGKTPAATGTAVDALRAKITGMTPNYPGYVAPRGMMVPTQTGYVYNNPYDYTNYQTPTTTATAPTSSLIGQQAYGGNIVGFTPNQGLLIDTTGNGVADRRTGVSPNTGLVNTYNFNLDQREDNQDNNFGGGAETGAAEAAAGGGWSSDPTGYSGSF